MLITNVTGAYFLKQNDTATRMRLLITEADGETPVDLLSAVRVEVVIGVPEGRILTKTPTMLTNPGELEFGLDDGDLLPTGDDRLEVHVYYSTTEKRVAPSKGFYKLRIQEPIDELNVEVTTYTLDYFLAEVNRVTQGLPETIARAEVLTAQMEDLVVDASQLVGDSTLALSQANSALAAATDAVNQAVPLLADVQDALVSATDATILAQDAAQDANDGATEAFNAADLANAAATSAVSATTSANNAANAANNAASNIAGYDKAISNFNIRVYYAKHNPVRYNGSTFRAKIDTIGNPLPVLPDVENEWWTLEAQKGTDGAGAVASVNNNTPDVNGNVEILIQDIPDLADTIDNMQTFINKDTFIATANQTLFTLTSGTYEPNENRLQVVAGGVVQLSGVNFIETSTSSFTMSEGLPAGTEVVATYYSEYNPITTNVELRLHNLELEMPNKVDSVVGKGLSTNDYTTTEKNKLAGIQPGAQPNTVLSVNGRTGAVVTQEFSGNYNDLTNKPVIFNGDYNALSNKPILFNGDYNSLTNKPSLFSGDYNDLTNKPNITDNPGWAGHASGVNNLILNSSSFPSLKDGLEVSLCAASNSPGDITLNLNGTGAKDCVYPDRTRLKGLNAGGIYTFRYNIAYDSYMLQGGSSSGATSLENISDVTTEIYVSMTGNDSNTGSISSPLRTPTAAMDKLKKLRAMEATVTFLGTYSHNSVLDISGLNGGKVIFATEYPNKAYFQGVKVEDCTSYLRFIRIGSKVTGSVTTLFNYGFYIGDMCNVDIGQADIQGNTFGVYCSALSRVKVTSSEIAGVQGSVVEARDGATVYVSIISGSNPATTANAYSSSSAIIIGSRGSVTAGAGDRKTSGGQIFFTT